MRVMDFNADRWGTTIMTRYWRVLLLIPVAFKLSCATKKASCNGWTLTAPKEGDFTCNPAGGVISTHGTRCTLNCDTGYSANHEVLVCSDNGGWVPTNSPECQVDSTMTLVIVLSIVASIIVIFGLSILYAKTSQKCRGKRRRLDDDDPEAANRRAHDTSTYYNQVIKLQRKRRLHAKQQSRSIEFKRKKRTVSEKEKRKIVEGEKLRQQKKRSSSNMPVKKKSTRRTRSSSRRRVIKKSTRDRKLKRLSVQEKTRNIAIDTGKKQNEKKWKRTLERLQAVLFCIPFRERRHDRYRHKHRHVSRANRNVEITRKPSPSAVTSPVLSSPSSAESSTNIRELKNTIQAVEKTTATLKKPPRPPPPKVIAQTTRVRERGSSDSQNEENHKPTVSSGYSSESGKIKRQPTEHNQSEAEDHDDEGPEASSDPPSKRVEMMSYDMEAGEKEESNPYDHYPVAQSYRQYLDFENDYRRTTGDYHPQYGNIKVIPIQTTKRKKKAEKNDKPVNEKDQDVNKSPQGGMKYIDIGTKESDDNDDPTKKHSKKNHKKRYENPSARDKRANLDDRKRKKRIKRSTDQKNADRKVKKLDETKRAIADEKIIVNGTTAATDGVAASTLPKVQKTTEQKKSTSKNTGKAKR